MNVPHFKKRQALKMKFSSMLISHYPNQNRRGCETTMQTKSVNETSNQNRPDHEGTYGSGLVIGFYNYDANPRLKSKDMSL
jgi:hypothetical protein